MIVVTVYARKPGKLAGNSGDARSYNPTRVESLRQQFRRHLKIPHRFHVLTDEHPTAFHVDANPLPLIHGWGGWWSKIELFNWDWEESVLYCDLDNVILGDITTIVSRPLGYRNFVMSHDWDYPVPNSSLMYWLGDYRFIYDSFRDDPEGCAARNQAMPYLGDQGHIAQQLSLRGIRPLFWQHMTDPGFFASRWDLARLDKAHMMLWHGHPKPWDLQNPTLDAAMALDTE